MNPQGTRVELHGLWSTFSGITDLSVTASLREETPAQLCSALGSSVSCNPPASVTGSTRTTLLQPSCSTTNRCHSQSVRKESPADTH